MEKRKDLKIVIHDDDMMSFFTKTHYVNLALVEKKKSREVFECVEVFSLLKLRRRQQAKIIFQKQWFSLDVCFFLLILSGTVCL